MASRPTSRADSRRTANGSRASEDVPKLLLTFEGAVSVGPEMISWCAQRIANLEIENCGPAGHQAPHDQPEAIAAAITAWALRHQLISS
jgi:haloalkane dehalogenase